MAGLFVGVCFGFFEIFFEGEVHQRRGAIFGSGSSMGACGAS